MKKYIRAEDKIYEVKDYYMLPLDYPQYSVKGSDKVFYEAHVKAADTIEDLIQIGDIIFYWQQSDNKEHCCLIVYEWDIPCVKGFPITKLLIPVGDDYKCVAKAYPSFQVIRNRKYLIDKGELELL